MDTTRSSAEPARKRPRVQLACKTCRDRKTRCDGRQPICLACEKRGVASICNFEQTSSQAARLSAPDGAIRSSNVLCNSSGRPPTYTPTPLHVPHGNRTADYGIPHSSSSSDQANIDTPRSTCTESFGPSSTADFVRRLLPAADEHASSGFGTGIPQSRSSLHPDKKPMPEAPVLPLRRNADDFFCCYWSFIHPVFPVLHKPTFQRRYEQLWTSHPAPKESEQGEGLFLATTNLVFAVGCRFSANIEPSQQEQLAHEFYRSSRKAYLFDVLDPPTIDAVQLLLLSTIFLQSTHTASGCWNTLGLAIRVAQSIGLHVEHGRGGSKTFLQTEMARRIWHVCVALDRLLAMTFGRPTMIAIADTTPLPSIIDDEELEGQIIKRDPGQISHLAMFVHSCRVFDVLADVLQHLYTRDEPSEDSTYPDIIKTIEERLIEVVKFNGRLKAIAENFPEELQSPGRLPITYKHTSLNLQQQVLFCRFLYVRLLCMRPLLLHTLLPGYREIEARSWNGHFALDLAFIRETCQQCVDTAHMLIGALYDQLGTLYRSAGWHTVYFAFSAATVVLASCQSPATKSITTHESFESSWEKALRILEMHRPLLRTATRAIAVLQAMREHLLNVRTIETPEIAKRDDAMVDPTTVGLPGNLPTPNPQQSGPAQESFVDFNIDRISGAWLEQCLADFDWTGLPQ
ncbi:hypothetical protein EJ03DRAFT_189480 [Teratosphaeria nubilosa]|uniref:Zn(2)-C6 fungal-type domain-containing protein n=1 Tax=Teratosphaeria nubilosa TaxID=161662 RepID=A0A6G1LJA9_9PEZI|nr:hypothetical protein EJ03DRAFT_189480 [Teratosphaeria nubilosa]